MDDLFFLFFCKNFLISKVEDGQIVKNLRPRAQCRADRHGVNSYPGILLPTSDISLQDR